LRKERRRLGFLDGRSIEIPKTFETPGNRNLHDADSRMDAMMGIGDTERISAVLAAMIEFESTLSDFYRQCAEKWTHEQAFWQDMAHAETGHAENIRKMQQLVLGKPQRYEWGRPFNPSALKTATSGLQENARRMAAGAFSLENALITSRDIEQSILEFRYGEIFKTADPDYQTLLTAIVAETYDHKKRIQQKIAEKKAPF
jgi:rubrerythrin